MEPKPILAMVIPCCNEEAILPETAKQLKTILDNLISQEEIDGNSKIIFIDDGSKDNTWETITNLSEGNSIFSGIRFSRNFGHQNALLAGLMKAREFADASITIDADLQQDVSAIPEFLKKYKEGNDVVLGVRKERTADSFLKKLTGNFFYGMMKFMGVDIIPNHADYRLLSKKALDILSQYEETNLFLRALILKIGLKSTTLIYEQHERTAGETKYSFIKMLKFALIGITSFSTYPINLIFYFGCIILIVCAIAILNFIYEYLMGYTVPGWPTILVSIWFFGGVQLISIGIIGIYIGKIYNETKRRPKFIKESDIGFNNIKNK
ncbi:MAG TPA: glycosyltransferase [Lentisphaeria bacterium]|nr:MAG: glycosyltransferase [Lentisphaerae bacterium GWF2_38_69]HBM15535.1 glycosyltransferase [Lentisphaeria bacterium]